MKVIGSRHRLPRITQAIHVLGPLAARRFIMSGTPVANKPEDLWAQFYFLDRCATLGVTFEAFQAQYCQPSGGYTRIDGLRERIKDLSLRREKEGSVNLPTKTVSRIPVDLLGRQREMYHELRLTFRTLGEESYG